MNEVDRFEAQHTPEPNSGCWLWTGAIDRKGYGRFSLKRAGKWINSSAHRFAYEALVGPIPDGLHIDHLCRVHCCVNPTHLEPVTAATNIRRGAIGLFGRPRTTCRAGHPWTDANVYRTPDGERECRVCRSQAITRWRAKRRAS